MYKPLFSLLSILLVCVAAGMALIKVWLPEAIPDEMFVKTGLSFAILAAGSVVVTFLLNINPSKEDKKEE